MKKLKFYISLAAILLLSSPLLMAQQQSITGNDPASGMGEATNFRFSSDVDLFFGVNDWADLEFSKWFSYLRMQGDLDTWEGGLALQLSKVYLGLYYYGRFNEGYTNFGDEEIVYGDDGAPYRTGPDFAGFSPGSSLSAYGQGTTRRNYYGILLGLGNHGIKFTVLDNLQTYNLPYVQFDADNTNTSTTIPQGAYGSFISRNGDITPKLQWGAASDMTFGKYTTRPSAFISLRVNYQNDYEFTGLTAEDGSSLDNVQGYENNSFEPTIGVDTGQINFWNGDWGTLYFGASEEFTLTVNNTEGQALPWHNKLVPYSVFAYEATEFFRLGAKLSVPVHLTWDGTNGTYFGIGSSDIYDTPDYPTLATGFQLKGSFFDKLAERHGILDKLTFNWGIKVNLPGYQYAGDFEYDDSGAGARITKTGYTGTWINPLVNGDLVQELSSGFTFYISPNVLLDASIAWNRDDDLVGRFLISVKHNGPKKAAEAPVSETSNEDSESEDS